MQRCDLRYDCYGPYAGDGLCDCERRDAVDECPVRKRLEDEIATLKAYRLKRKESTMAVEITHIDVGMSRQVASVLGERETVVVLCRATDGYRIRDNEGLIRATGDVPAACNCGECLSVARIMHDYDCGAREAWKRLQEIEKVDVLDADEASDEWKGDCDE